MKKIFLAVAVLATIYGCQNLPKPQEKFSCPQEEKVIQIIKKNAPYSEIKIEKIEKFKDLNLCQVEFRLGIKPAVFYTNKDGSLVFPAVIDTTTGENLSIKNISERRTIPEDILKKFEDYVIYKVGKGDRFVYFITEPDCKECEVYYKSLKNWADRNKVQIKIIVRPTSFHPSSYQIAKSVLCAKKTFDDMLAGYDDKKHCDEGQKKLEDTMDFIDKKMAMSDLNNPIIISDKGKYINSIPPTEENLKWLIQ